MADPSQELAVPAGVLGLCRPDEEVLEIFCNGVSLGCVTHDSVGWCGMKAVEGIVTRMAEQLGLKVENIEPPEDHE